MLPASTRRPRSRSCSRRTSSSASASGSSTRRSRTPPCPGCRAPRPASPRRSPRPRGSSARRSAWRSSARSSPPASARRPGDLSSASHPAWWTLTACGGVVLLLGFVATSRRADGVGPAHGGGAQSGSARCWLARDERTRRRRAREVWLLMSDLVLDNQRRREVSEALGMSFGRARAVRRAGAPADVDGRARRGAGHRPAQRDRASSTTSNPRASCAGGRIRPTGGPRSSRRRARARTWPAEPTRSSRTPPPALSALSADDLETLRRILGPSPRARRASACAAPPWRGAAASWSPSSWSSPPAWRSAPRARESAPRRRLPARPAPAPGARGPIRARPTTSRWSWWMLCRSAAISRGSPDGRSSRPDRSRRRAGEHRPAVVLELRDDLHYLERAAPVLAQPQSEISTAGPPLSQSRWW